MRSLTLAAGLGSRLRPLTNDIPKCMVPFNGVPILEHQILKLREYGILDNFIVTGYRRERVNLINSQEIHNAEFNNTNMVYSWALARHLLDGKEPLIVSYGDIIYNGNTLSTLLSLDKDVFGVVSDSNWEKYWMLRSENYLEDVESFSVDLQGNINSIGQKWSDKSEICGQYIGLFVVPASSHRFIKTQLDRVYNDERLHNMFMTDFLQLLIRLGIIMKPAFISSGWLEFDCPNDLDPQFMDFLNA